MTVLTEAAPVACSTTLSGARQTGHGRLLTSDGVTAAEGLALDEALMRRYAAASTGRAKADASEHHPGEQDPALHAGGRLLPGPTVRLYTYADHCALVGRYQNVEAEVDLHAAAELRMEVARRPTGGGAILMGAGQLGVAVATRAAASERPRAVLARMAQGVVEGLALAGVEATFSGKNDLEVAGRKIAGLGLYSDARGALLFHASVLADLDVDLMLSVLRIPAAKLGRRGLATVAERVTTLTALTGEPWDGARLRPLVARGFGSVLGSTLEPSSPDEAETAAARQLAETKYGQASWTAQRQAARDAVGTATLATSAGILSCELSLQGDVIKSALVGGDFNVMPPELIALEKSLRWQRADTRILRPRLEKALGESDLVSLDSMLTTILDAAASARPVESGAPERTGSCYFPEVSR